MLDRVFTQEGKELLTVDQAAVVMNVHKKSITNWIYDGKLKPAALIGRSRLYCVDDVKCAADAYQRTKPRGTKHEQN